eukprot:2540666-Rhodomonas_salina.2
MCIPRYLHVVRQCDVTIPRFTYRYKCTSCVPSRAQPLNSHESEQPQAEHSFTPPAVARGYKRCIHPSQHTRVPGVPGSTHVRANGRRTQG